MASKSEKEDVSKIKGLTHRTSRYFRYNQILLQVIGYWPVNKDSSFWNKYSIAIQLFENILMVLLIISQIILVVLKWENQQLMLETIYVIMFAMAVLFKSLYLVSYAPRIVGLCVRLDERLGVAQNWSQDQVIILEKSKNIAKRVTFALTGMFVFAGSLYVFLPLWVFWGTGGYHFQENATEPDDKYFVLLNVWLPVDQRFSPGYEIGFVFKGFNAIITTFILAVGDSLVLAVIIMITGHFKVIQYTLENTSKFFENKNEKETINLPTQLESIMSRCIHHHQIVLEYINTCERILNIYMMVLMSQNFLLISSALIQITLGTPSQTLPGLIGSFSCYVADLFAVCWYCNILTIETARVSDSAWNSAWYNASSLYNKALILLMIRSKKPVRLTVAKFGPITIDTFIGVIRASYSFFAVFNKN